MIFPIVIYGHSILRKKAKEIDQNFSELDKLIKNMWETLYETNGIGLSCPQIGKSIQLFIIDTKNFKEVFINPKIIEQLEEINKFNEGCLSIPEIYEDIERRSKIRVKYFDEKFKHQDRYFEDISAQVIQHEYDHLKGTLFIDHLSSIRRKLLKNKLVKISRGKFDVNYKTILSKY